MATLVNITVNNEKQSFLIEERTLLVDFLRSHAGLTGTHQGCDTAQCGCCVVHLNGQPVKSCNVLALQADGAEITTIEGMAQGGSLHPVQQAFHECHALQCGFCTPGMVMSAVDLIRRHPRASEEVIRAELDGNLCRCTGYHNIVRAIQLASEKVCAR